MVASLRKRWIGAFAGMALVLAGSAPITLSAIAGEPLVVGAIGPGAERFTGYQDNTEFGRHLLQLVFGK